MNNYHDKSFVHADRDEPPSAEALLVKVRDCEQKLNNLLNEPKEIRMARYREWFRKGLYGKN